MRAIVLVSVILLSSCSSSDEEVKNRRQSPDVQAIERSVRSYYAGLRDAYRGVPLNTDSLTDAFFDPALYYVTYWGTTEPIDTTKSRLRRALPFVREYANRVEIVETNVYGDFAYTFFTLRQSYLLGRREMDEYLPTTFILRKQEGSWKVIHAHRSADLETTKSLAVRARDSVLTQRTSQE